MDYDLVVMRPPHASAGTATLDIVEKQVLIAITEDDDGIDVWHHVLVARIRDATWASEDLPAGFRVVSTHEQVLPGSGETVTHILFSDGLANVSVFVGDYDGSQFAETSELGASNSFSTKKK